MNEITASWIRSVLPKRHSDANKGTFGRVLVIAGSIKYTGAAYLACSGAMRVGAGLVTLATPASLVSILAAKLTEATYLPLPVSSAGVLAPQAVRLVRQSLGGYNALLIGCGIGRQPATDRFVKALLLNQDIKLPPIVIDADALNILATTQDWWHKMTENAILTPHPGEMSRLTGKSVIEIQNDRVVTAKEKALEWRKTIVLKGANTVIASLEGDVKVNPVANPGLASAGTGDVLAGVIAGLMAQGLKLQDAAACGVYLHSQAGEIVREQLGDTGMLASDLLPALPIVIKRLKESPSTGAGRK